MVKFAEGRHYNDGKTSRTMTAQPGCHVHPSAAPRFPAVEVAVQPISRAFSILAFEVDQGVLSACRRRLPRGPAPRLVSGFAGPVIDRDQQRTDVLTVFCAVLHCASTSLYQPVRPGRQARPAGFLFSLRTELRTPRRPFRRGCDRRMDSFVRAKAVSAAVLTAGLSLTATACTNSGNDSTASGADASAGDNSAAAQQLASPSASSGGPGCSDCAVCCRPSPTRARPPIWCPSTPPSAPSAQAPGHRC